jgi:phosphohistidine phosphatase SixA
MKNRIIKAAPLLTCVLLLAAVAGGVPQAPAESFKVTTVVLVRHAEKGTEPANNPPLNESGQARARELARVLGGAGVKAIITSQAVRTMQTAEPLAQQLKLPVTPVTMTPKPTNPKEVTEQSIEEIVKNIEAHAGETVLVVGHSNTVPDVIRMLGGDAVPSIDERKFDDLFIVTLYGKRKARVAQLKYGSASP